MTSNKQKRKIMAELCSTIILFSKTFFKSMVCEYTTKIKESFIVMSFCCNFETNKSKGSIQQNFGSLYIICKIYS